MSFMSDYNLKVNLNMVGVSTPPPLLSEQPRSLLNATATLGVLLGLLRDERFDPSVRASILATSEAVQVAAIRLGFLLPDEQVDLATSGSETLRREIAKGPQALDARTLNVLMGFEGNAVAELLALRWDLPGEAHLELSFSKWLCVQRNLHVNPMLNSSTNLSYGSYVTFNPKMLDYLRRTLGADSSRWTSLGPTWKGDLVSLADACK